MISLKGMIQVNITKMLWKKFLKSCPRGMICILLIEVTLAAISPLLSSVIFFVVQMKKVGFGSFRVEAEKKKMEEGERK